MSLGCSDWSCFITERGGGQLLYEVPYDRLSFPLVLNASGSITINFPTCGSTNPLSCEICSEVEPFRHEVALYRGQSTQAAVVGPVWDLDGDSPEENAAVISARDLSSWLQRRFIETDQRYSADVADIFDAIVNLAMSADPSPNLSVSTKPTGVEAERRYRGKDFQRASDICAELSNTAVDWTMVGRTMLAGGLEILLPQGPLILHDEGVKRVRPRKEGSNFATDVAVFGAVPLGQQDPVMGRATRGADVYGLVQESFAELLIEDEASCVSNAESRVERMQPVPLRLSVTLAPEAAFDYEDIIPGCEVDPRPLGYPDLMRLQSAQVDVSVSEAGYEENISLDLVPLGLS